MKLTEQEKKKIIELIEAGKPLPVIYKPKLFDSGDAEYIEATKDYKLVYKGKARKEDIIAQTPAAPFQKIRSFNSDNKFEDGWQNMLIFGDNLLALKTIYEDQRVSNIYKTKNRIKLIYIDPPFATKQDFMKDREKAYRDKIIGAQFIEFLRKRLILMREILADDGSIFVHLDYKKGHYIKAILDEIFGEFSFVNEIVWGYDTGGKSKTNFPRKHDSIYWYKNKDYIFNYDEVALGRDTTTMHEGVYLDEEGRPYQRNIKGGKEYRYYLDKGVLPPDYWIDIQAINPAAKERVDYPTQKPEKLLERIIKTASAEDDIILDAFAGSGTTLAIAEKLKRRWIGMDCGKLSMYCIQKRMLNLTDKIHPIKYDDRSDFERSNNLEGNFKTKSQGFFFVREKVPKDDLVITDSFLKDFANFISSSLTGSKRVEFSLVCPKEKLKLQKLKAEDFEERSTGEKIVQVGKIKFLISFIQPKEKAEKEKPLKAREFTLYHAGVYDNKMILEMPWEQYKPFVSQLFGLRSDPHKIHGFEVDGYIGVHSAYIWDYPNQKNLSLDRDYVKTLHHVLGGKAGNRFYVVAPIIAMGFMEDEVILGDTTYSFLKVPLSILMALIEKGEPGSLKQPTSENDVNEVIDAIGFDFISQPEVRATYYRKNPIERNLLNLKKKDYSIEITNFKSNTLVYDPEDFENFETLSMLLVDTNYNEDFFNLSKVFWADQILNEEKTKAIIRIPEDEFAGKKMMVIFVDKYGNELKVVKTKKDFK